MGIRRKKQVTTKLPEIGPRQIIRQPDAIDLGDVGGVEFCRVGDLDRWHVFLDQEPLVRVICVDVRRSEPFGSIGHRLVVSRQRGRRGVAPATTDRQTKVVGEPNRVVGLVPVIDLSVQNLFRVVENLGPGRSDAANVFSGPGGEPIHPFRNGGQQGKVLVVDCSQMGSLHLDGDLVSALAQPGAVDLSQGRSCQRSGPKVHKQPIELFLATLQCRIRQLPCILSRSGGNLVLQVLECVDPFLPEQARSARDDLPQLDVQGTQF
mmetsp:Transcript_20280/g.47536  ORF Transcript_20280/g.47536 Transcript_20280/m.47536 type:complete len:264 (-) Transcript_20280:112-903(-)